MFDFDKIWGLDYLLIEFQIDQPAALYVMHIIVIMLTFLSRVFFVLTLGRFSALIDKFFGWLMIVMMIHLLTWGALFGIVLFVVGGDISLARSLYLYFVTMAFLGAMHTHLEYDFKSITYSATGSNFGSIVVDDGVKGKKPE